VAGQTTTSTWSSRSPASARKSRTKARLSATVMDIFQLASAMGLRILVPPTVGFYAISPVAQVAISMGRAAVEQAALGGGDAAPT